MSRGIFVFRRDLRVHDNTTLLALAREVDYIVPVFIFTPTQVSDSKNKYKSHNAVKFMVDSLNELNERELGGKLNVLYGEPLTVLQSLLRKDRAITHVGFNRDYTKYAQTRDARLLNELKANVISLDDALIFPLYSVVTGSGSVYKKYTPFMRKALSKPIPQVQKGVIPKSRLLLVTTPLREQDITRFYNPDKLAPNPVVQGGRRAGLERLQRAQGLKDYTTQRNMLTYTTSLLSAYNKFGCLSIREVARALQSNQALYAQLLWREFFYNLGAKHPEIFDAGRNGLVNRKVSWKKDPAKFRAWCEARTGVDIVDACMRQLNETGYMHNRGRLIVSNYLTRILELDWHLGERYFAQKLIDYDPIQNSFGWQISANLSGTESRPLAQTKMNPQRQAKRFDPTRAFRNQFE